MPDYLGMWSRCVLTSDTAKLITLANVIKKILESAGNYRVVERYTTIPWEVVAAIHFRESSLNFECHIHNGDSLLGRTTHVPKNRPENGTPPFTWAESALDAFSMKRMPSEWNLAHSLEYVERYNGLGYQRHKINSPYLWDFTDQYTSGLFVADGSFDSSVSENRPGAVPILKMLGYTGVAPDGGLH